VRTETVVSERSRAGRDRTVSTRTSESKHFVPPLSPVYGARRRYRRIRLSHRERASRVNQALRALCAEIPVEHAHLAEDADEIVVEYDLRAVRLAEILTWVENRGIALEHTISNDRLRTAICRTEDRCREVCCTNDLVVQ